MIFQHTLEQVLSGQKTQTRRLVGPGEDLIVVQEAKAVIQVHQRGHYKSIRTKWQTGSVYAVQSGRGKKAVARIRITDLRRQRLQQIGWMDAIAEGFTDPRRAAIRLDPNHPKSPVAQFRAVWEQIHRGYPNRWEDNPEVWAITFELVDES